MAGISDFFESVAEGNTLQDRDPNQVHEIVPPKEFIQNPYYTGSVNRTIWPFWKERVIEFLSSDTKFEGIFDGSTSTGKCISYDSKVHTRQGQEITIEEFVENEVEYIQSFDEANREIKWSKVNDWIDSGVKDVYEVETDGGRSVEVTSCHPFLTFMDEWQSIDDGLSEGSAIAVPTLYNGRQSVEFQYVVSVEHRGKKQVYDLEIEDTHTFIANDIIVHNTWNACLCLLYKLYVLTCFEYPQRLFGFSDNTTIGLFYFNIKKKIAKRTGWKDLTGFVHESRYFQEQCNRNTRKTTSLEYPDKNIVASYGSTESDIKGVNLLAIVLDETNFFKKSGSSSDADLQRIRNIYTDATDRIRQRFHNQGNNPGLAITVSSATDDSSFIEERKESASEHIYYVKAVSHKVHPDDDKYADERFWVFGGTEQVEPSIIDTVEQFQSLMEDADTPFDTSVFDDIETIEEGVEKIPTGLKEKFDNPPVNFRDRYEDHIYSALQNISGIPVGKKGKLFTNREAWAKCRDNREFPFTSKEPIISTQRAKGLDDYFKPEKLCQKKEISDIVEWIPKKNPGKDRFVYTDLSSTTDPSGLAMVHVAGITQSEGSGLKHPLIDVDFALRIQPPEKPARLDHDKILDFIGLLKNRYHFNIRKVGTDRYVGESVTQRLNKTLMTKEGEKALVKSMVKNYQPWLEFCRLLYKGYVKFGKYDIFRKEFLNLEDQGDKVDHPDEFPDGTVGTKDVSDSVVGATSLAIDDSEVQANIHEAANEILEDEANTFIDDHGNMNMENWQSSDGTKPFQDKQEKKRELDDEEMIDLLN